jgi:hypothetical protein
MARANTIHLVFGEYGGVPHAFTVKHEAKDFIRRNGIDALVTAYGCGARAHVITVRDGGGPEYTHRTIADFMVW